MRDHGQGGDGVTPSGYRSAIDRIKPDTPPIEKMHTRDFDLTDAELAIKTLARRVPGEGSIHLLPGARAPRNLSGAS